MYLEAFATHFGESPSGRIVDTKRMTTDLVCKALTRAYSLRQPPEGLVFHSDRGSQYPLWQDC
jgi:putative transposase